MPTLANCYKIEAINPVQVDKEITLKDLLVISLYFLRQIKALRQHTKTYNMRLLGLAAPPQKTHTKAILSIYLLNRISSTALLVVYCSIFSDNSIKEPVIVAACISTPGEVLFFYHKRVFKFFFRQFIENTPSFDSNLIDKGCIRTVLGQSLTFLPLLKVLGRHLPSVRPRDSPHLPLIAHSTQTHIQCLECHFWT